LKPKNILIVILVNYLIIFVLSVVVETWQLNSVANIVKQTMTTAADMTISQLQVSDEFFRSGLSAGFSVEEDAARILVNSGGVFTRELLFSVVYGIPETDYDARSRVFRRLFDNAEFRQFAESVTDIKLPVLFRNTAGTGVEWYYVPRINAVGRDILGAASSFFNVETTAGGLVDRGFSEQIFDAYDFDNATRSGEIEGRNVTFYTSPINLGMAYIPREFVSRLFVNNMDNIMRAKYSGLEDLDTPEGGDGVLRKGTFNDKVSTSVDNFNPINDGRFTFVRGRRDSNALGFDTFEGILPSVEYKVVDLYDPANDDLLVYLFGANRTHNGVTYSTKAGYLRSVGSNVLNPATNAPFNVNPVVVAKVTFYADIIIPLNTLALRELRSSRGGENNFVDFYRRPVGGDRVGASGNVLFRYTRFFVVR